MTMRDLVIRPEEPRDFAAADALTREAFWNLYRPGCDEHYLAHVMRAHPDYLADLSHVAELDGELVGSIQYTRSRLTDEDGRRLDTVTFGPLCVAPGHQRAGIGSRLIAHTRELAVAAGYPVLVILGDPHNYVKHGFKNGKDLNVCTADGKHPLGLLVLELTPGVLAGHSWRFQESVVFDLDQALVEAWDQTLPAKPKEYQYTQDLFSMMIRAVVE